MWQALLVPESPCQLKILNLQTLESCFSPGAVSWAPWGWTVQPQGCAGLSLQSHSPGLELCINACGLPRLMLPIDSLLWRLQGGLISGSQAFTPTFPRLLPASFASSQEEEARLHSACLLCICRSSTARTAWIQPRIIICPSTRMAYGTKNEAAAQRENSREL